MIPDKRMQEIYETAKRAYEEAHSLDEDSNAAHAAGHEFDHFIAQMMNPPKPEKVDPETGLPIEPPSQGQQLMELILEIDRAVEMVPPKLARYRNLLVKEGLDQVPVRPEEDADDFSTGGGTRTGMSMPGINLADQAALAYHSQILGLAFSIAQNAVQEKFAE